MHRLARTRPCSGATPNACSAALLSSMAHRHAVSLAAASLSGPQHAGAGAAAVDVELRYPAHGTSFAAHDGIAPEPDVPCACADGASTRHATATATAAARRRAAAVCCIVCSAADVWSVLAGE